MKGLKGTLKRKPYTLNPELITERQQGEPFNSGIPSCSNPESPSSESLLGFSWYLVTQVELCS